MNNAFTLLSTSPPKFSAAAAARVLRDQYGIEGHLKVLDSERDQNFFVEGTAGEAFVLKIANSAEAAGVTDLQSAALLHVEQRDPDLLVPRVMRTLGGRTDITIVGDDGREHVARVLSWLVGTPLELAEPRPDNAAELGSILARLGIALADFEHPCSDHVLLWDLSHAGQLTAWLDYIENESLREICKTHLHRFEEHTEPALNKLRSQVIYNDLHSGNVVVDPNNSEIIAGVIDFGDIVRAPLVIDVGVAAAYLCDSGDDPLSRIVKFLRGYNRVRPLQREELELIYDLIITRNVVTLVIGNWRGAQYPENQDYILSDASLARLRIETLQSLGQRTVTDVFLKACLL